MKHLIVITFTLFMISCSGGEKTEPETPKSDTLKNEEQLSSKTETEKQNETENTSANQNNGEDVAESEKPEGKEKFEGSIMFEIVIQAKSEEFNVERSYQYFGNEMTVYLKDGNYMMDYEGGNLDKIIYDKDKNKQYTIFRGFDSLFVLDCKFEPSTVYSKLSKDSDYDILNRNVKYVGIFTNNVKLHYYYDPEYYIDPDDFSQHNYGHLDLYYKMAKSPYIYAEQEFSDFKVIFRPKEIRIKDLDMATFKVPDMPLKESNINQMR